MRESRNTAIAEATQATKVCQSYKSQITVRDSNAAQNSSREIAPLPIAPPPVEKYLNADLPVMAVQVSKMDANESLHSEEDQLDSRPAVSKIP